MTDRSYPAAGHDHAHTEGCETVVRVSCVRHAYEDGTNVDLCGLEFTADRGSRVAILGPNGAGKSTMLFHILGLLAPQEGEVRVFGEAPSRDWPKIRRRIGVVLQNVDEQILAPTVFDDVAFSPRQYGVPEAKVREMVARALGLLDIEQLAARVPHNLSGGEKRKVALAGALVMEPELLVLDEPFEGLDPKSREALIALLGRLSAERGVTMIMSTHDIDSVPEFADYAYVLAPGGHIVLKGTPAEVFARADIMLEGNIRPPVLAELFAALRAADPDAPEPALTVPEAVRVLGEWRRG
ncbi:MAG: energy-coupling factor ABC transporter ATP-binding protein [Actinomycetota bacterium]|nr:energy-coupling factor ABC transporter ATP-binding protein [Actinomycetota bacterium]